MRARELRMIKYCRGWAGSLAAGLAIAAGASAPAFASKPVAIEKELLGIRVLQTYREVLQRYGAPTRIFRGTETVSFTEATNVSGAITGGILGIGDGSSSGGGGGPMGGMMGGSSGMPGGPNKGGGMSGMMGAGMPGMQGGGGGGAQGANDNPDASYSESNGFIWVYHYPGKELAYEFHFNRDGRIDAILERGRGFGQHTSRGIGLGDTLDRIYSVYGWTDRIKDEGNGRFSLYYNDKYHAQFLILKNRVAGIAVFLKETQMLKFEGGASGGGPSPGGAPGMGMGASSSGGMRMPGMGASGGSSPRGASKMRGLAPPGG